jgi:hypothetical protein
VAQMAVAEMRKLPPKLYIYGVGSAALLIAIIVSGMALHNYLQDHDSRDKDGDRPNVAAVQTAPAKRIAPSSPVNPASAAPNPAPAQAEVAQPAPIEPKPTLTVEEQPEPPATSRNRSRGTAHCFLGTSRRTDRF